MGMTIEALNELLKEAGEVVFDTQSGHEVDVDQLMFRRNELQDKREGNNREAATFPSGRHHPFSRRNGGGGHGVCQMGR